MLGHVSGDVSLRGTRERRKKYLAFVFFCNYPGSNSRGASNVCVWVFMLEAVSVYASEGSYVAFGAVL